MSDFGLGTSWTPQRAPAWTRGHTPYRPPAFWWPPAAMTARCRPDWQPAPPRCTGWTSSGCPMWCSLWCLLSCPRWWWWTGGCHRGCTPCSPPGSLGSLRSAGASEGAAGPEPGPGQEIVRGQGMISFGSLFAEYLTIESLSRRDYNGDKRKSNGYRKI